MSAEKVDKPSWRLDDADEIASQNKYTFFKPSRATIARVLPGDVVKLIFVFDSDDPQAPRAERMWVEVDEIKADGTFVGRLNNIPEWITDLQLHDVISFNASHIINTEHDDDDNLVERYIKRCIVSHRILEDGAKVGYLDREAPRNPDDSGWSFTADDESEEYLDNAANFSVVSLGRLLSLDDSFIDLLNSPEGSAYVRDRATQQFVPCEDDL